MSVSVRSPGSAKSPAAVAAAAAGLLGPASGVGEGKGLAAGHLGGRPSTAAAAAAVGGGAWSQSPPRACSAMPLKNGSTQKQQQHSGVGTESTAVARLGYESAALAERLEQVAVFPKQVRIDIVAGSAGVDGLGPEALQQLLDQVSQEQQFLQVLLQRAFPEFVAELQQLIPGYSLTAAPAGAEEERQGVVGEGRGVGGEDLIGDEGEELEAEDGEDCLVDDELAEALEGAISRAVYEEENGEEEEEGCFAAAEPAEGELNEQTHLDGAAYNGGRGGPSEVTAAAAAVMGGSCLSSSQSKQGCGAGVTSGSGRRSSSTAGSSSPSSRRHTRMRGQCGADVVATSTSAAAGGAVPAVPPLGLAVALPSFPSRPCTAHLGGSTATSSFSRPHSISSSTGGAAAAAGCHSGSSGGACNSERGWRVSSSGGSGMNAQKIGRCSSARSPTRATWGGSGLGGVDMGGEQNWHRQQVEQQQQQQQQQAGPRAAKVKWFAQHRFCLPREQH